MNAFWIFPEINVADYHIPVEKKKDSPRNLRIAKNKAIKAARELGYFKIFPNLKTQIENADKIDTISIYMSRCRKAC